MTVYIIATSEEAKNSDQKGWVHGVGIGLLKPIEVSSDSPVRELISYYESQKPNLLHWRSDILTQLDRVLFLDMARSARIQQLESDNKSLNDIIDRRDQEILRLEQEVQRLTGLVKRGFETFHYKGFPHNEPTWEQFKKENNL